MAAALPAVSRHILVRQRRWRRLLTRTTKAAPTALSSMASHFLHRLTCMQWTTPLRHGPHNIPQLRHSTCHSRARPVLIQLQCRRHSTPEVLSPSTPAMHCTSEGSGWVECPRPRRRPGRRGWHGSGVHLPSTTTATSNSSSSRTITGLSRAPRELLLKERVAAPRMLIIIGTGVSGLLLPHLVKRIR